jgi:urease accessory protein
MKALVNISILKTTTAAFSAIIYFLPTVAMAHPGHHGEGGVFSSLGSGFLHPLSGLDHMLLALAIGWLALSLGVHRVKELALAFLCAIIIGALCGRWWISSGTGLEVAISLTILAAGFVMLRDRISSLGMFSIVAVAGGLVHGLAHGAEALPNTSFATYVIGLLVSTILLLGAGGLLQRAFSRADHRLAAIRVAGLLMIVAGVTSLFGIL